MSYGRSENGVLVGNGALGIHLQFLLLGKMEGFYYSITSLSKNLIFVYYLLMAELADIQMVRAKKVLFRTFFLINKLSPMQGRWFSSIFFSISAAMFTTDIAFENAFIKSLFFLCTLNYR